MPNQIAAVGESAGGYLAALLATTSGKRLFDVWENLDQTSDALKAKGITFEAAFSGIEHH